jgi:hypothetical protein
LIPEVTTKAASKAASARAVALAVATAVFLSLPAPRGEAKSTASGVRGIVTLSGCPGPVRPGESCTRRFEGARVRVVKLADGHVVRTFQSLARGRFRVRLPAGRYRLDPLPSGIARAAPVTIDVGRRGFRYVHIDYDNGLR